MSFDSEVGSGLTSDTGSEQCQDSDRYFFETSSVYEASVVGTGILLFTGYLYEESSVIAGVGSTSFVSRFFFVVLPMFSALLGSVALAYKLRYSDLAVPCKRRVVSWMVFGGLAGVVTAGVILLQNNVLGGFSANPLNTVLLVSEAGMVAGTAVGVYNARNITSLEKLRDRRQSLEKYRKVFESTENPVVITDTSPEIVEVNDAYVEKFGYTRDELVGENPSIVGSPETPDETYDEMWGKLDDGETWSNTITDRDKDGRRLHLHLTVVPIQVDRRRIGYAGVFADVTEMERMTQSLKVINRALRHDLRNDLSVALGRIGIAKKRSSSDEVTESLEDAEEKLKRINKKADQARETRKILEAELSPDAEVCLEEVLDDSIDRVRDEPNPDSVEVEVECLYGDSETAVRGIGRRYVRMAFEEVIENAVEHATDRIEVGVERNEETAVVSVADDGSGVPDRAKEEIFGRREIDDLRHGEGMGLFLVDRIVERSGGRIWVEDSELGGADFRMELRRV